MNIEVGKEYLGYVRGQMAKLTVIKTGAWFSRVFYNVDMYDDQGRIVQVRTSTSLVPNGRLVREWGKAKE